MTAPQRPRNFQKLTEAAQFPRIARLFSLLSETLMNRSFQTLLHCVAPTVCVLYVGKIVTAVFTITEADFDTDCFRLKIELSEEINDLR